MLHRIHAGDSLESIINSSNSGDTIIISEGVYDEKVKITASNIIIKGEGKVIIRNKDYYSKLHIDNKEYNTFRTYTLMVSGDNVTIDNVEIVNLSTPSRKYGQAVALHVLGNNFKLLNSKLISAQDTLFLAPLPLNLQEKYIGFLQNDELSGRWLKSYFYNCYIEGDVDYVFGASDTIFKNCHFHSISGHMHGYVFAPSHEKEMEFGFTVVDSKFTADKKNSVLIARPWRDYGKVTIINSSFEDGIVIKDGFDKWNNSTRDKTARFEYYNLNIDTTTFVKWAKELNIDDVDKYLKHVKN